MYMKFWQDAYHGLIMLLMAHATSGAGLWLLSSQDRIWTIVGIQETFPGRDPTGGSWLTTSSKPTSFLVEFSRDPLGLFAVASSLLNLCMFI